MEIVTTDDVAAAATAHIVDKLRHLTNLGQTATIALSGGSTPWVVFEQLAQVDLPWEQVHIYQVDERVAPAGDPDRNLTNLRSTLLDHVPAVMHPFPVEEPDLEAAMQRYAEELPAVFDLVHLGMGGDGHTASLVPGDASLDIDDADVAITEEYKGHRRVTLTYPPIDRAASILWIVTGDGKQEALRQLIAADTSIPAGRVRSDRAVLLTNITI